MVKYSGLYQVFQEIVDHLDLQQSCGTIPSEKGAERDKSIKDEIKSVEKSDEVIKEWAIATKMRRWLIQKKQSIAERVSKLEIEEENALEKRESME